MLDPGSTGGAIGNDSALENNLTDPCWLLDRAAKLLHAAAAERPTRSALPLAARSAAGVLSALRYQADTCGEPLGEVVSQTITHLRLWASAVAVLAEAEEQERAKEGARTPG